MGIKEAEKIGFEKGVKDLANPKKHRCSKKLV